jgi:hypothetical protein
MNADLIEPPRPAPRAGVNETLRRHAEANPEAVALLHKQCGAWRAFRWRDILHNVAAVADLLRQDTPSGPPRVAVSGPYQPDLIVMSLAAEAAGGVVFPVPRRLRGEALQAVLAAIGPTHAFVQARREIPHWLRTQPNADTPLTLFSPHVAARQEGVWRIAPLPASRGAVGRRTAPLRGDIAWMDEGSDWTEGLALLFERWLGQGVPVAFPETSLSAFRDRKEIQPTALLASARRRQQNNEETRKRLAPPGSLGRKVSDWALSGADHPLARLLRFRIARLVGESRLTEARRIAPPTVARVRP